MDRWVYGWRDGWRDGLMDLWINGRMQGWMDGWRLDAYINGQVDRRMVNGLVNIGLMSGDWMDV